MHVYKLTKNICPPPLQKVFVEHLLLVYASPQTLHPNIGNPRTRPQTEAHLHHHGPRVTLV